MIDYVGFVSQLVVETCCHDLFRTTGEPVRKARHDHPVGWFTARTRCQIALTLY